jgi:phosphatidylglycerol:prolipoprotein diacylglycerol transferase
VIFPGNEFDRQLLRPFPRHPSQLYQAALEGLLLFLYLQWRFWRGRPETLGPGRLSGEFLLGYALARIIGELFREPDAPLLLGLSRGTFYSLFLVAAGSFLILRSRRRAAGGERSA